jgi:signal transduction histidine kinase
MISRQPPEAGPSIDIDAGRERRVQNMVVVGTALLVLILLASVAFAVLDQRREILSVTEMRVRNLVQVIEEQTGGSIAAVEIALAGTARTLQLLPGKIEPRQPIVHALLRENVAKLPFVRAIWVLDAEGNMIHDSDNLPGKYNLSDREYFRVQRDDRAHGLYVDRPIRSRLGVWFIGVSRRIENPDGSFAGVIVAALEPKYLQRFYESIDVGKEGTVGLYQPDGTLMVRAPETDEQIGRKLDPPPQFVALLPTAESGQYRSASSVDGIARIYSYRRVKGKPLVVVVGVGEAESLAGWRNAARIYALASVAFVLVISWLGYLVLRELHRRSVLSRELALDIARRKQAESLLESERRALEMIAAGATLPQALDTLVRIIEEQAPEMLGSILLLDADGVHLRHGAAPSLPERFARAIDGEAIREGAGSCGTAAFRRAPVIVEDIATDALWRDYRELAAAHGLRACWSTPIFDAQQQVLGTFAMYFRTPRRPSDDHQRLIAAVTHIAAIAISKSLEEARLRNLLSRLRVLSRRLVEVAETERRSINRELHDRIGQNLSTLNLNFDLLRSRLPEGSRGELVGRIDCAQRLLESTIVQVRNVMAELHPPALDDFGLLAALCAHAEAFGARVGTPIVVHGEEFAPRLPRAVEYSLLRIAQEAVANAAKHAHAKRIDVTLASTPERVTLTIADDGAGFDTVRPRTTSWGLTVMRERAEAAGAALNIESTPGGGTRVTVAAIREAA